MSELTDFKEWLPEIDFDRFPYPMLVAGGALRDSWFEKDVTDVDLFIGVPGDLIKECWNNKEFAIHYDLALRAVNYIRFSARPFAKSFINFKVDFDGEYDAGDFVSGRSSTHPGLNVILFEHEGTEKELADKLFDKFPCSISRIAWSPKSDEWYIHDSFKKSACDKVIGFHGTVKYNDKYYKKIYPKYEGWGNTYETVPVFF